MDPNMFERHGIWLVVDGPSIQPGNIAYSVDERIMERSHLQQLLLDLLRGQRKSQGSLAAYTVLLRHAGPVPGTDICIRDAAMAGEFERRLAAHIAKLFPRQVDFGDMLTKSNGNLFLQDCPEGAPVEAVALDLTALI